jgi:hypothetical protein
MSNRKKDKKKKLVHKTLHRKITYNLFAILVNYNS